jgi:hypothetical protein
MGSGEKAATRGQVAPNERHLRVRTLSNVLKARERAALQCPFKAWVAGSNPAALTILLNDLETSKSAEEAFPHKFPHKLGSINRACLGN